MVKKKRVENWKIVNSKLDRSDWIIDPTISCRHCLPEEVVSSDLIITALQFESIIPQVQPFGKHKMAVQVMYTEWYKVNHVTTH